VKGGVIMADETTARTESGNQTSEGTGATNQGKAPVTTDSKEPDSIPYAKYRELLGEKKDVSAKFAETKAQLDKLLAEQEESNRKALEDQNQFKQLYESERKKASKAVELLEAKEREAQEEKKFVAFQEKVGGLTKAEYRKFFDADKIPLAADGSIDEKALESYANEFKTKFPELLKPSHKAPPPGTAPKTVIVHPTVRKSADDILAEYKANITQPK
jgi:hypothetical protein